MFEISNVYSIDQSVLVKRSLLNPLLSSSIPLEKQYFSGITGGSRFGDPKELAGAAVYLASEKAASFVTGSDIVVDGGFLSQTI